MRKNRGRTGVCTWAPPATAWLVSLSLLACGSSNDMTPVDGGAAVDASPRPDGGGVSNDGGGSPSNEGGGSPSNDGGGGPSNKGDAGTMPTDAGGPAPTS